jgi:exodeoxyribonuclease VII large subunit
MRVQVYGEISVYEKGGAYQIVARRMEEAGAGSLHAAFLALKARLQAEGLFDESRKKPIPLLPRRVGVITSPSGAAIRDILKILSRGLPNIHVVLAPVKVQGEGAAGEIAAAVDLFNRVGGMDVLIVGRGGGSLEDLWCFNEEEVARAIARSRIPVISAVGHEVDFTISDFVADWRAPTPSAAAEIIVGRREAFEEQVQRAAQRLGVALRQWALEARSRLASCRGSSVFREPRHLARVYRQRVDSAGLRMNHQARSRTAALQQRLDETCLRLDHVRDRWLAVCRENIRRVESQLRALNPMAVLERGYSITWNAAGDVIRSAADVAAGERVRTTVARGSFESEVTTTHEP